ncbi:MAG: Dephospho-CoA kinase [uncultured bacterium]|nr:MAG: Dephospho-CoA kinase [uncultured bacterium]
MLIIGLTGGIGSGKTTVANIFAQHGVPVLDADKIARDVTKIGTPALNKIVERFGINILNQDGSLERSKLRDIIFTHPNERLWLEKLLHPLILEQIQMSIQQITAPYCIIVIPLLLEMEPYPFINRVLVIDATKENQLERVAKRDKLASHQIKSIMQTQLDSQKRLMLADDIIKNNGDIANLEQQIEELHQKYLSMTQ